MQIQLRRNITLTWLTVALASFGHASDDFAGLPIRGIGPAFCSGRITDFAVHPDRPSTYFVATASGGLWKTTNSGITYSPVFDNHGSYSIGCVAMAPSNPNVIWVGTGENNSQRSVSFGDGVYRSRDGGKNFEKVGLENSEHIGMIAIHPSDADIVYVAAQGPLWRSGGDRGLYKTTDGGTTWRKVLEISDDTGINEVHLDPRDPDTVYASAYQRRRHVWTLINGGPESGIYKSTDGGESWRQSQRGLPSVDLGRIGLDLSPANPDVLYAIVEAADGKSGFYRSEDRGESWTKRSSTRSTSPQYYNEIVCDPHDVDVVYSLDTFTKVSVNGGETFRNLGNHRRHVDDHALWIDPDDTTHLLIGGDGGIYETFDSGSRWDFKQNLSLAQMYRVSVDESEPFYYVYGGTQDNNSFGGPARTTSRAGVLNEDWFVTVGGDGYETVVDPEDPNILYSQWQYGGLVRHDRRSGEIVDIKPRVGPDDEPLKWNWDTPLILSSHSPTRLYFAANRLFRSDDRGNSWQEISADLTRGIDRDQLPVMGRIWEVGAVAKNMSTSMYGNAVSLTESPLDENVLYVGTDDGLVHMTRDSAENWSKISSFPTVPEMTYVSDLEASRHDVATVYAAFDNHKNGDFRPYLLRSTDYGATWRSIRGDLPERHVVYCITEDHVDPKLWFAGTEFGVFYTVDAGEHWVKFTGLPTIAVRDLEIQRRENDLVLGTFGRGIYVLDDYTPLRSHDMKEDAVFPPRDAWLYVERSRLGGRSGLGSQGASFFAAPNPDFGVLLTYQIKSKLQTRKEQREKREAEARKQGRTEPYPTLEELRAEDQESAPEVALVIRDSEDRVVRRLPASRQQGVHRTAWDLRAPTTSPIRLTPAGEQPPWVQNDVGPLVLPGTYQVELVKVVDGVAESLSEPVEFDVKPLGLATLAAADPEAVFEFQKKVGDLHRAVQAAGSVLGETSEQLRYLESAIKQTPDASIEWLAQAEAMSAQLDALTTRLWGDSSAQRRSHPTRPSIASRVGNIVGNQWYTTNAPTQTELDGYRIASEQFASLLVDLRKLVEEDIVALQRELDAAKAPWTPGRLPKWEHSAGGIEN